MSNIIDLQNATFHDCSHAWNEGKRESGVYTIKLSATSQPFDVFCRMTSTGGFTVMQRRMDGSVNFDRSWNDYKNGFGSLEVCTCACTWCTLNYCNYLAFTG